jgi:hypothetical protein
MRTRMVCRVRGRNILDRHRRGPATAIQDRTTRYRALRRELRDLARRATLNLLAGAITVAISGCVGPPVLERQVLGYDEVTPRRSTKSSCFSTSPASLTKNPFTSRQPRASPPRLTGQQRWAPAVRSRSRKEPTSLTSTSVGARRRIRRSASLPFRARSLPSES